MAGYHIYAQYIHDQYNSLNFTASRFLVKQSPNNIKLDCSAKAYPERSEREFLTTKIL